MRETVGMNHFLELVYCPQGTHKCRTLLVPSIASNPFGLCRGFEPRRERLDRLLQLLFEFRAKFAIFLQLLTNVAHLRAHELEELLLPRGDLVDRYLVEIALR